MAARFIRVARKINSSQPSFLGSDYKNRKVNNHERD